MFLNRNSKPILFRNRTEHLETGGGVKKKNEEFKF